MASGFEFHAKSSEVLAFALETASEMGLFLTMIYGDKSVVLLRPDVRATSVELRGVRWVCFTRSIPNLEGVSQDFDFVANNGDRLSILLGQEDANGLEPSMLQFPTKSPNANLWKQISSALKMRLHPGGWIYWPSANGKRQERNMLVSSGAIEFHNSGNSLWGSGRSYVHIPGLDADDSRLNTAQEG
jgi:hypothetical protein